LRYEARVPTEKLYWEDPFRAAGEARVAQVAQFQGKPSIVLDRTLFYPEGGGQLGDRGALRVGDRTIVVHDVQIDDDGVIHHVVDSTADDLLGAQVQLEVDRARRRDHMSQHTGQHVLSRALIEVAKAETVSARLGSETSTIDVSVNALDERAIAAAEDLVNDLVLADAIVRSHFPTAEELAAMPLRRAPKVSTGIRVIEVEGFDFTPCGGTHVGRTGQIGAVRVTGVEKYKGGTRVTFLAGRRALDDARGKDAVLRELARAFTCGVGDVPNAVGKLRADLKSRTDAYSVMRGELVQLLADRLHAAHPVDPLGTRIVVLRDGDDLASLRALAGALARRPDVIAFVGSRDEDGGDLAVVVERGGDAKFDCGAWLKSAASSLGGRGGGRPERAEGRLPPSADLAALALT
jgi:alanyl-tRNA synthetase